MEFFCQIIDGKLQTTRTHDAQLVKIKNGLVKVSVESANKRSTQVNRYYWGCMLVEALKGFRDLGYDEIQTTSDVHEIFKAMFLRKHFENKDGLVVEYVGSTAKLTNLEFIEYMEKIGRFCSLNLSVTILAPNTQSAFDYAT